MEGNKTLLRSVEEKDGQYYGVLLKGNILVPLDSASVAAIYMYDQKKSRTQTVALVTGVTLGVVLGLVMLGIYSLANAVVDIVYLTI